MDLRGIGKNGRVLGSRKKSELELRRWILNTPCWILLSDYMTWVGT